MFTFLIVLSVATVVQPSDANSSATKKDKVKKKDCKPKVKTQDNSKTSTEENSKTSTKENSKTGTEENSKTSTEENSKTSTEENSETTTKENSETTTKENPKRNLEENSNANKTKKDEEECSEEEELFFTEDEKEKCQEILTGEDHKRQGCPETDEEFNELKNQCSRCPDTKFNLQNCYCEEWNICNQALCPVGLMCRVKLKQKEQAELERFQKNEKPKEGAEVIDHTERKKLRCLKKQCEEMKDNTKCKTIGGCTKNTDETVATACIYDEIDCHCSSQASFYEISIGAILLILSLS